MELNLVDDGVQSVSDIDRGGELTARSTFSLDSPEVIIKNLLKTFLAMTSIFRVLYHIIWQPRVRTNNIKFIID